MINSRLVEEGYDKIASAYHEAKDPRHNHDLLVRLCDQLPLKARVLDAGCGAGIPASRYLADSGCSVIGIDVSDEMLTLSRKHVPSGVFIKMSMESMEFEDNYFDAIVSSYAIFHIPRTTHASIYKSFQRILKQDGLILVSVGFSDWEGVEDFYGTNMYWSHYSWEDSLVLIKEAGFETLHYEIREPPNDGKHVWVIGKNVK